MPYEQPLIHKTPNQQSADSKSPRLHQPRPPLIRIWSIVGIVSFIVVIIAVYFWY